MFKQSFDTFRVFGCKILNLQSIDRNIEAEINCGIAHILGIPVTNSCWSLTESTYFEKKLIFCRLPIRAAMIYKHITIPGKLLRRDFAVFFE